MQKRRHMKMRGNAKKKTLGAATTREADTAGIIHWVYTTTSSAWRMVRETNFKEKCLGYLLLFIQYMVVMERM